MFETGSGVAVSDQPREALTTDAQEELVNSPGFFNTAFIVRSFQSRRVEFVHPGLSGLDVQTPELGFGELV